MSALRPVAPPSDAREVLGRAPLLAVLEHEALDAVLAEVEWFLLPGGETVFEEGDEPDAMYVVARGRMRATVHDLGGERFLSEVGGGEVIGEIGLLVDIPRSATVRAMRDTLLARLSRATFNHLLVSHPAATLPLTRGVAARLVSWDQREAMSSSGRVDRLAVVANSRELRPFLEAIVGAVRDHARAHVLWPDEHLALDDTALATVLDDYERDGIATILAVDADAADPDARVCRQADRVLFVARARSVASLGAAQRVFDALDRSGAQPAEELALLHDASTTMPSGSGAWLALREFRAHHHLRDGDAAAVARLGRHLTGRAIGLVLGGGGARGFAHVGAFRALEEAGIPIDKVGGSSIGGVMATQLAMGLTPEEMQELNRREWGRTRPWLRFTMPVMSVMSGGPITRMFNRMYGDVAFEDLWLPAFVTTVNLTSLQLVGRERGRVAHWVRASASPPGMFPPAVDDDGHLVVDGGVLDNVPCDLMARRGAGHIIAVSLSRSPQFAVTSDVRELSLQAFARYSRHNEGMEFPTIGRTLQRTAMLTSLQALPKAAARADVFVEPGTEAYGFTEFRSWRAVQKAGYDAMRTAIADHPEMKSWI